jgi:hypothetical protein
MACTASPSNIVVPVTLEASVLVPEPLRPEHCELFWDAAKDNLDGIFQWIPYRMESREAFNNSSIRLWPSRTAASP